MNKKSIFAGLAVVVVVGGVVTAWQVKSLTRNDEQIETPFVAPIVVPTPDPAFMPIQPQTMLTPKGLAVYKRELAANSEYLQSMRMVFAKSLKYKPANGNSNIVVKIALNQNFRELSRLLIKESEVRMAEGKPAEAMNSRLDCLRLAVLASNGGLLEMLSAGAVEDTALGDITPITHRLTGKQCLEFESEIAKIQSFKPAFADVLENEKASQLARFNRIYGTPEWTQLLTSDSAPKDSSLFNQSQINELKTLSKKQIEDNLIAVYDAIISRSKLPYSQAKDREISSSVHMSPYAYVVAREDAKPIHRFVFSRNVTMVNLLRADLLNKARNSKTPVTFDFNKRLPDDPFGNGALKTNGRMFYSVGPDGIDDKGTSVPQLAEDAKGDILAFWT